MRSFVDQFFFLAPLLICSWASDYDFLLFLVDLSVMVDVSSMALRNPFKKHRYIAFSKFSLRVTDFFHMFRICCLSHMIKNGIDSIPDVFHSVLTSACKNIIIIQHLLANLNFFRPRLCTQQVVIQTFWIKYFGNDARQS